MIEELLPRRRRPRPDHVAQRGWEDAGTQGQMLRLGLFERPESISHLRRRLPAIDPADADELAAELATCRLAVAAAGALLATEKTVRPRVPAHAAS